MRTKTFAESELSCVHECVCEYLYAGRSRKTKIIRKILWEKFPVAFACYCCLPTKACARGTHCGSNKNNDDRLFSLYSGKRIDTFLYFSSTAKPHDFPKRIKIKKPHILFSVCGLYIRNMEWILLYSLTASIINIYVGKLVLVFQIIPIIVCNTFYMNSVCVSVPMQYENVSVTFYVYSTSILIISHFPALWKM